MDDGRVIDQWEGGIGWIADPDEPLGRASHALVDGGDVWVVEPVDVDGLDAFLRERGEVAGVVVAMDRHRRDAAAVASRHDVAVHLPRPVARLADDIDAPTEVVDGSLADTGFRTVTVLDNRFWAEVALHRPRDGTLLVPEAVGTARHYLAPGERLGVHPALRLTPLRRALSDLGPARVLVGHGQGIHRDAAEVLGTALRRARRTAPRLYASTLAGSLGLR